MQTGMHADRHACRQTCMQIDMHADRHACMHTHGTSLWPQSLRRRALCTSSISASREPKHACTEVCLRMRTSSSMCEHSTSTRRIRAQLCRHLEVAHTGFQAFGAAPVPRVLVRLLRALAAAALLYAAACRPHSCCDCVMIHSVCTVR